MHENRRIEWKIEIAEKKTKTIEKDREEMAKRELEWRKKTKNKIHISPRYSENRRETSCWHNSTRFELG